MTVIEILKRRARHVELRTAIMSVRMSLTDPFLHGARGQRIASRPLRVVRWHRGSAYFARPCPGPAWVACPTCGAPPYQRAHPFAFVQRCRGRRGGPLDYHPARYDRARGRS